MRTIYRVQDAEGRGPFRPGLSKYWVDGEKEFASLPPWPSEFGMGLLRLMKPGQSFGCGCNSLSQLHRWFSEKELCTLMMMGFSVVKMDVDQILAESDNQIVFARSKPLNQDIEPV